MKDLGSEHSDLCTAALPPLPLLTSVPGNPVPQVIDLLPDHCLGLLNQIRLQMVEKLGHFDEKHLHGRRISEYLILEEALVCRIELHRVLFT